MIKPWSIAQAARLQDQKGVTIILVAILMFVFIGIAALAIDLSSLYVVGNELQNAADAGALAGARFLYNDDGTAVSPGANLIAFAAATDNRALSAAGPIPVEVQYTSGNAGDVQRGHWSFATREFTPNDSLVAVPLWGVTTEYLDDPASGFVNAIRVVTRREESPAAAFFSRIFGFTGFGLSREAVAYIGFAGTLAPGDVDLPIAICAQSLTGNLTDQCGYSNDPNQNSYDCNMGFMLSDGQQKNTAAWTNFTHTCATASTGTIRDLLTCADSNPNEIVLGDSIGATNGVVDAVIGHPNDNNLMDCWKNAVDESGNPIRAIGDEFPSQLWNLTLPTVDCVNLTVSNCMETCGAVNVNIAWILEKGNKIDDDAPFKMAGWNMENEPDGLIRWNNFVTHFNIRKPDLSLATCADKNCNDGGFKKKSIYFLPDCTPHELKGNTGGRNYGILARIPVLVH